MCDIGLKRCMSNVCAARFNAGIHCILGKMFSMKTGVVINPALAKKSLIFLI